MVCLLSMFCRSSAKEEGIRDWTQHTFETFKYSSLCSLTLSLSLSRYPAATAGPQFRTPSQMCDVCELHTELESPQKLVRQEMRSWIKRAQEVTKLVRCCSTSSYWRSINTTECSANRVQTFELVVRYCWVNESVQGTAVHLISFGSNTCTTILLY